MPNKTFAEKVLTGRTGHEETDVREAVGKERQMTGRAAELELRSKDGCEHEAFSWALFQRSRWRAAETDETLILLFASCVVSIKGRNLQRLTEMIREERLEVVQEHDAAEAMLLESENQSQETAMRKAIVTGIVIEPGFDHAANEIRTLTKGQPYDDDRTGNDGR